jgi:GNAT superfamily N-acetyltransferase
MRAKEFIVEAFDKPYQLTWEKSDYSNDLDAYAKLDDGNYLSIMFNKGYDQDKKEAWNVEFFRNNSQEITGEGDSQRIFATVLNAIQQFVKKYKPNIVMFAATSDIESNKNTQSRSRLYDSLVNRYARSWGYASTKEHSNRGVMYKLIKTGAYMNENYIDSKNIPKRVKRDGIELAVSIDGQNVIIHSYADSSQRQLGYVVFDRDGNTLVADDLAVDDRYHGQGIARIMYDYVKELGFTVKRSSDQTQAGKAFWDKNKGQDQNVWEHQG